MLNLYFQFLLNKTFKLLSYKLFSRQKAIYIYIFVPVTTFTSMRRHLNNNQGQSSEYSEDGEGVNLHRVAQKKQPKPEIGRQSFKMIMSRCYEQKIFGSTLPIAANFFPQNVESNQQSQLNFVEQEEGNQNNNPNQKHKLPIKKNRVPKKISLVIKNRHRFMSCFKGKRYQTRNICKNLFTETSRFLKQIAKIHVLNDDQIQIVDKFVSQKKFSLESFQQLFKSKEISLRCAAYYRSIQFVSSILKSGASIKGKLILLKYLEKIRKMPYENTKAWKK